MKGRPKVPTRNASGSAGTSTGGSGTRSKYLRYIGVFIQCFVFLGGVTIGMDLYVLWPNASHVHPQPATSASIPQSHLLSPHAVHLSSLQHVLETETKSEYLSNYHSHSLHDQKGHDRVLQMLHKANVSLDAKTMAQLPTWSQIVAQYGPNPVIFGLDTCTQFRNTVPELRRMLGAAGMFSTGTNLVTSLLKSNCQIPARVAHFGVNATKEAHGMRWQVPWGKHTPASYRLAHATEKAKGIAKEDLLPIVTIRNPWRWMQSMCKNPYSARWPHHQICPHLQDIVGDDASWIPVTVKYGAAEESYQSLVHLYNEWYALYRDASYPRLIIRMEDLIFRAEETVTAVCECAGGLIRRDQPFQQPLESAKNDSPGHDTSIGMVEAWIKYSQPLRPNAGFTNEDYNAGSTAIDPFWMSYFQYQSPPV